MRLLIQRVNSASVIIDNQTHAEIGKGMLIFLGIHKDDSLEHVKWLTQKCISLRIFEDQNQKMNLSIEQINGEILIISQFTLYGNCTQGRRPEFTQSAAHFEAKKLYHDFIEEIKKLYPKVKTGIFAADMKVGLINDGPVTLILEK